MANKEWTEKNGVIRFSVTSDGTTGKKWIPRLEGHGFFLTNYAKSALRSRNFHRTNGVTTDIAVLKGELFVDDDRVATAIRAEAKQRNLQTPNVEVACLIRENFSDEDLEAMGLCWVITMHKPIKTDGDPRLLSVGRVGSGGMLSAFDSDPGSGWLQWSGFAFVEPQVQP
jgi:hypothetical protein